MKKLKTMSRLKYVDFENDIIIMLFQLDIKEYQLVVKIKDKEERTLYRNKDIAYDMFWFKVRFNNL